MALRGAAVRMGRSLRFYRQAAQTHGFFQQLDRLIEELLREDVSWEALAASARAFEESASKRKVAEIARLYREYLVWLGHERVDPAQRLAQLRERLADLPWLHDASVWVDGFAGFTGQELATLVALARAARDVTITLLLDPHAPAVQSLAQTPDSLHLFQRTEQTYQRLCELFAAAGVTCAPLVVLHPAPLPRFADSPNLARLEAGLATPIGVPFDAVTPPGDDVRLWECATHRDELRAVARFIRGKIANADGELHFRDFAVIARDLGAFAPLVAEVFAEHDLPYFLDRRRPMRSHPLSRFIEALFETLREDFSVASVTRLLRTGLLPLARAQAERLENIATALGVHGLASWRQERWDSSADALESPRGAAADAALDTARLDVVAGLEPLLRLAQADPPPDGAAWTRALDEVLETLGVRRRVEEWMAAHRGQRRWEHAETHRLAWESLCTVLEDMYEVLGETPLWADDVAALLTADLREQSLGLAPPTLDQILVSSIERSRHPPIKYAWVFAFNEGIFPARPGDDELLSTTERQTLTDSGLAAPASHRDDAFGERLLAYIAFTRPSHGLTISYATVGLDGSPLLPSPLLDEVCRILPGVVPKRPEAHAPPACLAELARGYLEVQGGESPREKARYERICAQVHAENVRLDWLLRGTKYRNAAENVGNYRACADPGVIWSGSPSEIETFLDCPFKHFAKYGLRLDAARGPRPVSWDLGSFAHEILADVVGRAAREPNGVRGLSDERWEELLGGAVADFRRRLPGDVGQRRPDLAFLSEMLYDFVGEVVSVHAERYRRGAFEPLYCEQVFGAGAEAGLPALELETTDGRRLRLRGKIDRVDCCRDGEQTSLLVYDYKTSLAPVGGVWLTGAALQLFSYLLAVQRAFGDDDNARVVGALLAPLYPDAAVLDKGYAQDVTPIEQRMYMYRPQGLFAREVAPQLDAQLGQVVSPVVRMKLKRDNDFDKTYSRDVVPPTGIDERLELARQTLVLAAEGIAAGQVEATPLVERKQLACNRCDFRPLCRFDRALNQPRAAPAALPTIGSAEDAAEDADA